MGRYFGLMNLSRNQSVSEGLRCWKAYPFCDVHEVMHRYHWEPTDKIMSAAYDSSYKFVYQAGENVMDVEELTPDFGEDEDIEDIEEEKTSDVKQKRQQPPLNLGFGSSDDEMKEQSDHVPTWKGDTCTTCGYKFNPKNMENDQEKFNTVFFCN